MIQFYFGHQQKNDWVHSAQSNHDGQGLEYFLWKESAGEPVSSSQERSHLWADVNSSPGNSEEIIKLMEPGSSQCCTVRRGNYVGWNESTHTGKNLMMRTANHWKKCSRKTLQSLQRLSRFDWIQIWETMSDSTLDWRLD